MSLLRLVLTGAAAIAGRLWFPRQGKILGVGMAGPANIKSVGPKNAVKSLHQAVTMAWDHLVLTIGKPLRRFLA